MCVCVCEDEEGEGGKLINLFAICSIAESATAVCHSDDEDGTGRVGDDMSDLGADVLSVIVSEATSALTVASAEATASEVGKIPKSISETETNWTTTDKAVIEAAVNS